MMKCTNFLTNIEIRREFSVQYALFFFQNMNRHPFGNVTYIYIYTLSDFDGTVKYGYWKNCPKK
jgi:hypothetical protein